MGGAVIDNLTNDKTDFNGSLAAHGVETLLSTAATLGVADYLQASAYIARGYSKFILDKDVQGGINDVVAGVQAVLAASSIKTGPVQASAADITQALGLAFRGLSKLLIDKDVAGFVADVYAAAKGLGIVTK